MDGLVGIVGGAGAEGSYFADILKNSGLEIAISDTNKVKAEKLCSEFGYELLSSEELVSRSNLILFSLPIDITESEIRRLAPLANEAIADLTSIKTNAMKAMIETAKPEVEIFSVHAMYRPTVSPKGQNVIFIPGNPDDGGKWFHKIKKIMEQKKANVSILKSAVDHDDIATALMVLPHAVTYAYLTILSNYTGFKIRMDDLQKYSTLFFRLMMETTGRVVSDPNAGKMYGLIQIENPNTELIYGTLIDIFGQMKKWVQTGDVNSFCKMHRYANHFMGAYAQAAAEATDKRMGHPMGIEIFYEKRNKDAVEAALRGFRNKPAKFKENIESTIILNGELHKFKKSDFAIARQVFYRAQDCQEGTFAYYMVNRDYPGTDKGIRFSPIFSDSADNESRLDPHKVRVQMLNRFNDPILNLFDTWRRTAELGSLGELVAYKTE